MKRHRTSRRFLPVFGVLADLGCAGDFVETDGTQAIAELSVGKVDCCFFFCVISHSHQQLCRVGFCSRSCLVDQLGYILHFLVGGTMRAT